MVVASSCWTVNWSAEWFHQSISHSGSCCSRSPDSSEWLDGNWRIQTIDWFSSQILSFSSFTQIIVHSDCRKFDYSVFLVTVSIPYLLVVHILQILLLDITLMLFTVIPQFSNRKSCKPFVWPTSSCWQNGRTGWKSDIQRRHGKIERCHW